MIDDYLASIGDAEPLPKKREREVLKSAKRGNALNYELLMRSNLKFVITVAKRYQGQGLDLEDLIAEGNFGLVKAFNKFDIERNVKFITYGVWWIRQTILNAIHENAKLIRLPINKLTNVAKTNKAMEILSEKLGRAPSVAEISEYLENPDIVKDMKFNYSYVYLDAPQTDDGKNLNNVIKNPNSSPGEYELEFRKELNDIIKDFPEREKTIIEMYYGIGYVRNYTLKEIGEKYSLTRERIRQIKEKVIAKLRLKHRQEKLRIYL